ncbi:hypothetical protein [Mangrovicoccus sp. HB161399]|nr:hypothetical protein [Mangrovicoccus sp. HB161399]
MTEAAQTRQFDADEAIAIYEDSISYYMPEAVLESAVATDETLVEYSEAA